MRFNEVCSLTLDCATHVPCKPRHLRVLVHYKHILTQLHGPTPVSSSFHTVPSWRTQALGSNPVEIFFVCVRLFT